MSCVAPEGTQPGLDTAASENQPDPPWMEGPEPPQAVPRPSTSTTPPTISPGPMRREEPATTPASPPAEEAHVSDLGTGTDRRPHRRKSGPVSPIKASLADIYTDKQGQANAIRLTLIEAKQKWKGDDIESKERMQAAEFKDRQAAREAAATAVSNRAKEEADHLSKEKQAERQHDQNKISLQHKNELERIKEQEKVSLEHEEKRMKLHHDHQMEFLKQTQTYVVLTEFLCSTKTEDQLQNVLQMLQKT